MILKNLNALYFNFIGCFFFFFLAVINIIVYNILSATFSTKRFLMLQFLWYVEFLFFIEVVTFCLC